jgi:hypothetical protein
VSSGRGRRNSSPQLLGVVPLVQRAGLVDALVALQPHQPGPRHLGDGLGEFRLADPGRALHEERLAEPVGEEDGGGDGGRGQIAGLGEACADIVDGREQRGLRWSDEDGAGGARAPGAI